MSRKVLVVLRALTIPLEKEKSVQGMKVSEKDKYFLLLLTYFI